MLAFRSVGKSDDSARCLLFWASGGGGGWWACEVGVDLAGDVALQTAQDVELGQALSGPPLDIGPGLGVAVHADQRDPPQGMVSPAIAAAIQPVAVGAIRGCWIGAVPHRWAKEASERSRWGLSP